jgi:GNAT superfamily N-acetyltransferase
MSEVAVRRTTGADPDAQELVAAMTAETGVLYGGPPPAGSSASPEELSPPEGGFVLLLRRGRALAGGGLKHSAAGTCEIKRMYVVPEARGSGLGARLLEELEALARDLGYAVARLDTGAKQPGAQRLYERAGYVAIPDFNGDAHAAWWGEKRLA